MPGLSLLHLIAIPLIGAATGYGTNYIAVRMLFRPRRERRIAGLRWQGLIPRRRAEIAETIGETVQRHLISHDDLRAAMRDPEVENRMKALLDERISGWIAQALPSIHPMAGMFLSGEALERVKGMILGQLLDSVPALTEEAMDALEEKLNFQRLVVEKIEGFDLETFERIVLRIASRELRMIEALGGALGFAIGILTDALLFL